MSTLPHRSLSLALLALVGALSLACGGAGAPTGSDNEAACQRYVDHMNGLDCVELTYDREEMCSTANLSPADMVPYWDCAREHSACDGDTPVIEIAQCRQPQML